MLEKLREEETSHMNRVIELEIFTINNEIFEKLSLKMFLFFKKLLFEIRLFSCRIAAIAGELQPLNTSSRKVWVN